MTDETAGMQDHPLVGEFLKPAPSLSFAILRRDDDGSEMSYPFRCRLLRYEQQTEALVAARKYVAETLKIDPSNTQAIESSALFSEAQAFEVAWRSCVHVDRSKLNGVEIDRPLFANPKQMRSALMTAEVAQLLNAFEITKSFYGVSELNEEVVEKLLGVLENELTGGYFLSQLDSDQWPRLIFILARLAHSWRPERLRTRSNSPSSSESHPSNSDPGTTGSSKLPSGHSTSSQLSGVQLPTAGQLSKSQAQEIVKKALAGEKPEQE